MYQLSFFNQGRTLFRCGIFALFCACFSVIMAIDLDSSTETYHFWKMTLKYLLHALAMHHGGRMIQYCDSAIFVEMHLLCLQSLSSMNIINVNGSHGKQLDSEAFGQGERVKINIRTILEMV